jgi:hypothetical protein
MDCLEFRRQLGAEPGRRDAAFLAHRDGCPACAAAWARAQQFDRRLADALAVPPPPRLAERVLLAQATAERMARRKYLQRGLALAASAGGAFVLGRFLGTRNEADDESLRALAVAHLPGEAFALGLKQPIPVSAIEQGFSNRGLRLAASPPPDVTYVHDCPVGPYRTVHLVMQRDGLPVTVIYVVGHRNRAHDRFERAGWHGTVVPLRAGTLVAMAANPELLDGAVRDWRLSIDGPAAGSPLA